jgi:hypothetical protein
MRSLSLLGGGTERAEVGDDGSGVGVVHVVDVHRWPDGRAVGADALFEHGFGLIIGEAGEAGETRSPFGPIVHFVNGLDPDGGAVEPARRVEIAVGVTGRVAFAAHGDLLDEVLTASDVTRRRVLCLGGVGRSRRGGLLAASPRVEK